MVDFIWDKMKKRNIIVKRFKFYACFVFNIYLKLALDLCCLF